MRCSVVFGVTLRLLVTDISSSSPAINTAAPAMCQLAERWLWSTSDRVDNTWHVAALTTGTKARYRLRFAIPAYPTCIRRPVRGRGFRWSIAMTFAVEKLEWCGYRW